jgi:hypothetical protein
MEDNQDTNSLFRSQVFSMLWAWRKFIFGDSLPAEAELADVAAVQDDIIDF